MAQSGVTETDMRPKGRPKKSTYENEAGSAATIPNDEDEKINSEDDDTSLDYISVDD